MFFSENIVTSSHYSEAGHLAATVYITGEPPRSDNNISQIKHSVPVEPKQHN